MGRIAWVRGSRAETAELEDSLHEKEQQASSERFSDEDLLGDESDSDDDGDDGSGMLPVFSPTPTKLPPIRAPIAPPSSERSPPVLKKGANGTVKKKDAVAFVEKWLGLGNSGTSLPELKQARARERRRGVANRWLVK